MLKLGRSSQSIKSALLWVTFWIICALVFNGLLWFYYEAHLGLQVANEKALAFLTGYLIEKSLSFDNLFVFYLIFQQLRIPSLQQQRIFNYGIGGAIILRLLLILAGTWLVHQFHFVLYIMGGFLIFAGAKIFFTKGEESTFLQAIVDRIKHRHAPFFIILILIELSDLVFALDSIPAIFAITTDPMIIWTANIFAILGLRSLYFVVAQMADRFTLLKYGIALILVFVGIKMLVEPWLHVPVFLSLIIIVAILLLSMALSWKSTKNERQDN